MGIVIRLPVSPVVIVCVWADAKPPEEPAQTKQLMILLNNQLIQENNLPPVVFHSLRHSSVTYKLKLNGGDIKAVQGDFGHAQVSMVTDVYPHILDDDRKKNAEMLAKVLSNPEMAALLTSLAKTMKEFDTE